MLGGGSHQLHRSGTVPSLHPREGCGQEKSVTLVFTQRQSLSHHEDISLQTKQPHSFFKKLSSQEVFFFFFGTIFLYLLVSLQALFYPPILYFKQSCNKILICATERRWSFSQFSSPPLTNEQKDRMGGNYSLVVHSDPLAFFGHPCACPVFHSLFVSNPVELHWYLRVQSLVSCSPRWFQHALESA